jgi:hypothetical protein
MKTKLMIFLGLLGLAAGVWATCDWLGSSGSNFFHHSDGCTNDGCGFLVGYSGVGVTMYSCYTGMRCCLCTYWTLDCNNGKTGRKANRYNFQDAHCAPNDGQHSQSLIKCVLADGSDPEDPGSGE